MIKIGNTTIEFVGSDERVVKLQTAFLGQLRKSGNLNLDKLKIDNTDVKVNTIGVAVFMDLTNGNCGYSHVMPSEVVDIFKALSSLKRPQFHWWSVYKGSALPNPTYPLPCKKPWEEEKK